MDSEGQEEEEIERGSGQGHAIGSTVRVVAIQKTDPAGTGTSVRRVEGKTMVSRHVKEEEARRCDYVP